MSEITTPRHDGRQPDELRPISMQTGIAPNAAGSVLCSFGDTQVICAASVENNVPPWMKAQGVEGGWTSAEYSMLPYSTLDRKRRDVNKGKLDGRSVEIQRLIGRSIRAIIDLKKLPGFTIWLDCDVLRADGGTRTASITGAYVALRLAVNKLLEEEKIPEDPILDSLSAVSAGIVNDQALLDLNYIEDRDAQVDANVIMTGSGKFVEVQSTGEEATYSADQLQQILSLCSKGIQELTRHQEAALA